MEKGIKKRWEKEGRERGRERERERERVREREKEGREGVRDEKIEILNHHTLQSAHTHIVEFTIIITIRVHWIINFLYSLL